MLNNDKQDVREAVFKELGDSTTFWEGIGADGVKSTVEPSAVEPYLTQWELDKIRMDEIQARIIKEMRLLDTPAQSKALAVIGAIVADQLYKYARSLVIEK